MSNFGLAYTFNALPFETMMEPTSHNINILGEKFGLYRDPQELTLAGKSLSFVVEQSKAAQRSLGYNSQADTNR